MPFNPLLLPPLPDIVDEKVRRKASTHKSYFNRDGGPPPPYSDDLECNRREEWLGDAKLGQCVARFLYTRYPQMNAGILTVRLVPLTHL